MLSCHWLSDTIIWTDNTAYVFSSVATSYTIKRSTKAILLGKLSTSASYCSFFGKPWGWICSVIARGTMLLCVFVFLSLWNHALYELLMCFFPLFPPLRYQIVTVIYPHTPPAFIGQYFHLTSPLLLSHQVETLPLREAQEQNYFWNEFLL